MSVILLFYVLNLIFYVYNAYCLLKVFYVIEWEFYLIAAKGKVPRALESTQRKLHKRNTNASFHFNFTRLIYATLQETTTQCCILRTVNILLN